MITTPVKLFIYSIIFFPVIVFIGIVTSYEDFLSFKIKNKWILTGLFYSFSVYAIAWILFFLASKGLINPSAGKHASFLLWNFDKWCINLTLSFSIMFLLWYFKILQAGDAKIFITYVSLIPIGQYSKIYFNYYFPAFYLILTTFLPITFYIFLMAIIHFLKKHGFRGIMSNLIASFKQFFLKKGKDDVKKLVFGFFILFLFFSILRNDFQNTFSKILPNQYMIMLVSMLVFKQLSLFFKNNFHKMEIIFFCLLVYIIVNVILKKEFFLAEILSLSKKSISISLLFPLINKIVDYCNEKKSLGKTSFAHWIFLGVLIVWFF